MAKLMTKSVVCIGAYHRVIIIELVKPGISPFFGWVRVIRKSGGGVV